MKPRTDSKEIMKHVVGKPENKYETKNWLFLRTDIFANFLQVWQIFQKRENYQQKWNRVYHYISCRHKKDNYYILHTSLQTLI